MHVMTDRPFFLRCLVLRDIQIQTFCPFFPDQIPDVFFIFQNVPDTGHSTSVFFFKPPSFFDRLFIFARRHHVQHIEPLCNLSGLIPHQKPPEDHLYNRSRIRVWYIYVLLSIDLVTIDGPGQANITVLTMKIMICGDFP